MSRYARASGIRPITILTRRVYASWADTATAALVFDPSQSLESTTRSDTATIQLTLDFTPSLETYLSGVAPIVFTSRTRTGGLAGTASAAGAPGGSRYSPGTGATDAIGDRGGTDG